MFVLYDFSSEKSTWINIIKKSGVGPALKRRLITLACYFIINRSKCFHDISNYLKKKYTDMG